MSLTAVVHMHSEIGSLLSLSGRLRHARLASYAVKSANCWHLSTRYSSVLSAIFLRLCCSIVNARLFFTGTKDISPCMALEPERFNEPERFKLDIVARFSCKHKLYRNKGKDVASSESSFEEVHAVAVKDRYIKRFTG